MAINFPSAPTANQEFTTSGGATYIYNGTAWVGKVIASSGGAGISVYSSNVGNGSANTFTIVHSLDKTDIDVIVRENSSGYFVYPDVKYANTNAVIIQFVSAPTSNQYYVSVLG